jgi:hypothetical protein
MTKQLFATAALLLLAGGPALAIAPNCQDQLKQISAQINQQAPGKHGLQSKYKEAQRLCSQNEDERAQALARQIREELSGNARHSRASESSGSSLPSK